MPFDETVSPSPGGEFDFHPVWPEPDTMPSLSRIGARQSRTVPQERIDPRPIDLLDFMDSCQHSPGMVEFAIPISDQLNWLRAWANILPYLPNAAECPQKYLSLIAGNYGFELIDMPYATESERRQFVLAIPELYARRGTLWAINRIIELLGFTATFEEYYQVSGIWNQHQFWNPSSVAESEQIYDWNDNTMQGWANQSYGHFEPIAQKLRGVGQSGMTDSPYQSCNIADAHRDSFLRFKFTILTPSHIWLGCNIRWQDASNFIRVQLYVECTGGGTSFSDFPIVSGLGWTTGEHTLRIWDEDNKVTVILDNTTLRYEFPYASTIEPVKKGLWVDEATIVDFDDFAIRIIDRKKQPKSFTEGIFDKELRITLSGSPEYAGAKAEYLEKIIPNFTPLDTTVVWV
jgi:hypothetical protein